MVEDVYRALFSKIEKTLFVCGEVFWELRSLCEAAENIQRQKREVFLCAGSVLGDAEKRILFESLSTEQEEVLLMRGDCVRRLAGTRDTLLSVLAGCAAKYEKHCSGKRVAVESTDFCGVSNTDVLLAVRSAVGEAVGRIAEAEAGWGEGGRMVLPRGLSRATEAAVARIRERLAVEETPTGNRPVF
ncbi:MAG: uncharacterized protein A8A55_2358 [Amphiamblys sp. WSBS2006]|nr:MAG: uncharacterized protein A8A55_2358 [Amphiamblys sp. WSBS2006]